MADDIFADGFSTRSYWWEKSPRPQLAAVELPRRVDVAVVGSGYTGLHAALQTARGGRSTLVFDEGDAGSGCSTRNGGQISTSVKPDLASLARRHGEAKALAMLREGHDALEWIGAFVAEEKIDCDFRVCGRFHAAHNAPAFARIARTLENEPKDLQSGGWVVRRADQHAEIGTDAYHGGVVYPRHASLDPGRYHQGLLDRVLAAGGLAAAHCRVTAIERTAEGFRLLTPSGAVQARDVVIATNGYTGKVTPWHRRRVIPIGSYIIATEPIAPELMDRLFPTNRIISDSRRVVYYYRPSPDRRRVLFGGRVSQAETDPRLSALPLRAELVRLFPELSPVRVTHSWMGFVAYTFDTMAHCGKHEGMYYAMGYCGSGVSMASWLGMRIGLKVLGRANGRSAFDDTPFPTRPFYWGKPWFLAASVSWYRWQDSRNV